METIQITQWDMEQMAQNLTVSCQVLLLLWLSPKGLFNCTCNCGLQFSSTLRWIMDRILAKSFVFMNTQVTRPVTGPQYSNLLHFSSFTTRFWFKVFQRVLVARVWSWALWLRLNMCDGSVLKVMGDFSTCLMCCCMYVNCGEYQHLHYRSLNYPKMLVNVSNSIYTDSLLHYFEGFDWPDGCLIGCFFSLCVADQDRCQFWLQSIMKW